MPVRHPLRSIFPTLFVATPLALLLGACAGDGPSRPDVASEHKPTVEAVEPAAPATAPGSNHEDGKDNPPTDVAHALPPAPYGWRLHRAPRRIGAGASESSWRIAGDLGDLGDGMPIVVPAAPASASRLEPLDSAPVAQTIALTAPATSTKSLLDPAPATAVTEEAAAISVPADPERASDALVAYAAAAKAAPATKPTTVAPSEPKSVAPAEPMTVPAAAAPVIPAAADVAAVTEAAATPVEEEVIDRPEWIINVATHASYEDAQRHVEQLQSTGFKATIRQETVRGRASHRVVIESLPSEAAAKSALANLSKRYGIESAWVMRKR